MAQLAHLRHDSLIDQLPQFLAPIFGATTTPLLFGYFATTPPLRWCPRPELNSDSVASKPAIHPDKSGRLYLSMLSRKNATALVGFFHALNFRSTAVASARVAYSRLATNCSSPFIRRVV